MNYIVSEKMKPIKVILEDFNIVQDMSNGNYIATQKCSLDQLSHMIERAGGNPGEIIKKLLQDGVAECEIA